MAGKRLLIVYDEDKKGYIVEFAGMWARVDIDRAFLCASRELPAYQRQVRTDLESQKELTFNEEGV